MDSSNTFRSLRLLARGLTAAATGLLLAFTASARADLIDQRNEMIAKFVNEMHADPLVADCAAHGAFVAGTSNAIDHVEFPPSAFESSNASIKPWNEPFDEGKQRVKVDNVVTVEGQGIVRDKDQAPLALKFRCGYVGPQMLAFSWNDPVPAAKPHQERTTKKSKTRQGAKHGVKKPAKKSGANKRRNGSS